ncbi:MFS transporter [Paenibacillus sp. OSY-SE]|uniref:MFS transporter n=1 Tax=Paenibacillus sp. OSY-SE TaxID=1196323 RepID=UPI0002DD8B16|nr:MFS transporter [Paenibacillus sp. OSY-SE]
MQTDRSLRKAQMAALWVVGIAIFTDMLVYGLIVPVLPRYALSLGASQGAIGMLFGSYAAALLLATPLMGIWSDRAGRRIPMLFGLFGLAGATILFGFSHQFWLLVVARILQGVAAAATWTAGLALLADIFPPAARGKAMGYALSGQAAGMLLGPAIGGWLYQWGGYHLPFLVAAGLALVDGFLRFLLLRDTEPAASARQASAQDMFQLIRRPKLLLISGVIVLGASLPSALEPTLPIHLQQVFSASPGLIGLLFAIPTVAYGVTSPLAGTFAYRWGAKRLIMIGLIITAIALPWIGAVHHLTLIGLLLAVLGIGFGCILTPTLSELSTAADDAGIRSYGFTFAIYNTAYSFGMFAGPTLSGTAAESFGLKECLILFSIIAIVYAVIIYRSAALSAGNSAV